MVLKFLNLLYMGVILYKTVFTIYRNPTGIFRPSSSLSIIAVKKSKIKFKVSLLHLSLIIQSSSHTSHNYNERFICKKPSLGLALHPALSLHMYRNTSNGNVQTL